MTEHTHFENAKVDFWISDYGQLVVEILSENNDSVVLEAKKVKGNIPFPSTYVYDAVVKNRGKPE